MIHPPCILILKGVKKIDWMQAPTKKALEAGRNVGGIKAAKTLSLQNFVLGFT